MWFTWTMRTGTTIACGICVMLVLAWAVVQLVAVNHLPDNHLPTGPGQLCQSVPYSAPGTPWPICQTPGTHPLPTITR